MADVTVAEVDQAAAELRDAKKASQDAPNSVPKREAYNAAADRLAEVRSAWRAQEEAAGRRAAVPTIGEN
jgi:hypothetical protein